MDRLAEARTAHTEAVKRMHDASDAFEAVDVTDEAATTDARDAFAAAKAEADTFAQRVKDLEAIAEARAGAPLPDEGLKGAKIVSREPNTYDRRNQSNSWILDLARSETGHGDAAAARARLSRHAAEQKDEIRARAESAETRSSAEWSQMVADLERENPRLARAVAAQGMTQRAVSRVDTTSMGEFVPPLWLVDQYAPLARAARPFADAVRQIPLPGGTDSINIPRITTGFLTGVQTADNAAVTTQDAVSATVTAPVRTIAGNADVAMQLLDQSPISFDEVVFQDLLADYNAQVDVQTLNGSGASGQLLGILNVSGINSVSFTTGSPTLILLWPKLADATQQSKNNRKLQPTHAWVAGRRSAWMTKELDGSSRPLLTAIAGGPNNAYGSYSADSLDNLGAAPFANLHGVNYYDALNMPTTLSANQDAIIVTRMDDHILFEGQLQARVLKEVLSGTLGVRFQIYNYVAFTAGRFPAATSAITGTGLTTPTF